jgi:hypothetical protein
MVVKKMNMKELWRVRQVIFGFILEGLKEDNEYHRQENHLVPRGFCFDSCIKHQHFSRLVMLCVGRGSAMG